MTDEKRRQSKCNKVETTMERRFRINETGCATKDRRQRRGKEKATRNHIF